MLEMTGDLWTIYRRGEIIVITTNGIVRADGACVMGRGLAEQAAKQFPNLPYRLGRWLQASGNVPIAFMDLRIVTMPVKHHWHDRADLALIESSAKRLMEMANSFRLQELYLPRPGCGNGRLVWKQVKPVIEDILDDRFTVVEYVPTTRRG